MYIKLDRSNLHFVQVVNQVIEINNFTNGWKWNHTIHACLQSLRGRGHCKTKLQAVHTYVKLRMMDRLCNFWEVYIDLEVVCIMVVNIVVVKVWPTVSFIKCNEIIVRPICRQVWGESSQFMQHGWFKQLMGEALLYTLSSRGCQAILDNWSTTWCWNKQWYTHHSEKSISFGKMFTTMCATIL